MRSCSPTWKVAIFFAATGILICGRAAAQTTEGLGRNEVRFAGAQAVLRDMRDPGSGATVQLSPGEPLLVRGDPSSIDGGEDAASTWLRVERISGEAGWIPVAELTPEPASGRYTPSELPAGADYNGYLAFAGRRGERVGATEDFEVIKLGDLGWLFGRLDQSPLFLVVWDRDLDNEFLDIEEALLDSKQFEDLPRTLEERCYFIFGTLLEMTGEERAADFAAIAREWRRNPESGSPPPAP